MAGRAPRTPAPADLPRYVTNRLLAPCLLATFTDSTVGAPADSAPHTHAVATMSTSCTRAQGRTAPDPIRSRQSERPISVPRPRPLGFVRAQRVGGGGTRGAGSGRGGRPGHRGALRPGRHRPGTAPGPTAGTGARRGARRPAARSLRERRPAAPGRGSCSGRRGRLRHARSVPLRSDAAWPGSPPPAPCGPAPMWTAPTSARRWGI